MSRTAILIAHAVIAILCLGTGIVSASIGNNLFAYANAVLAGVNAFLFWRLFTK